MRGGREAKSEFNESLALDQADDQTLGSQHPVHRARFWASPMPFTPPKWARKVTKDQLKFRGDRTRGNTATGGSNGAGRLDTIRDNERIRFELLAIVMGVWDYIKNSGDQPTSANWGMDWVGMIPGKRGSAAASWATTSSRKHDLEGGNGEKFDDAVAIGGWPMDDHPPTRLRQTGGKADARSRAWPSLTAFRSARFTAGISAT